MNFDLPEEIRMLKDTVRKFVDRELIPIERTARDEKHGHKLKAEVRAHLAAKAKELGLAGYDVPVEYGGLGMGLVAKVTVWAELSRSIALPSRNVDIFGPNVSPILYHLNDEQKKKYLLPTIAGELKWCLAQTEPEAGGDPGGMRTTAVREGDHYVINGMKRFITHADEAHYCQLIAATDRAKGSHGGISEEPESASGVLEMHVRRPGHEVRADPMSDRPQCAHAARRDNHPSCSRTSHSQSRSKSPHDDDRSAARHP